MGGAINCSLISTHFSINAYFLTIQTLKHMCLTTQVYSTKDKEECILKSLIVSWYSSSKCIHKSDKVGWADKMEGKPVGIAEGLLPTPKGLVTKKSIRGWKCYNFPGGHALVHVHVPASINKLISTIILYITLSIILPYLTQQLSHPPWNPPKSCKRNPANAW